MAQARPMGDQTGYAVMSSGGTRAREEVVSAAGVQTAAVGLALVEAVIGYEWLLSAVNKILSPSFRTGLAAQVKAAISGNPNTWWVALAKGLVLPHTQLFALLVEVGELLVALGFLAGAALWVSGRIPTRGWTRVINLGVIGALAGSALMTANYYLMSGETLPLVDPSNPFNEGLSIDGLLTLVAVGLLFVHLLPLRRRRT
jgi:thiosulfate dehydrogenase [quinone] large subunit